jgi:hypothetical protein
VNAPPKKYHEIVVMAKMSRRKSSPIYTEGKNVQTQVLPHVHRRKKSTQEMYQEIVVNGYKVQPQVLPNVH